MLDIGWAELLVVAVVALIVIGPKDLPAFFHTIGKLTAKARHLAFEFRKTMEQAAQESGLDSAGRALDDIKHLSSPQQAISDHFQSVLQPSSHANDTKENNDDTTESPNPIWTQSLSPDRAKAANRIHAAAVAKSKNPKKTNTDDALVPDAEPHTESNL